MRGFGAKEKCPLRKCVKELLNFIEQNQQERRNNMNLIDKDAVVATIKKHVEEERHSYFCKCLLSEIDALKVKEQPEPPSNLDEAAEKYFEQYNYMPKGFVVDAFKAGAEWMAGQGISCECEITKDFGISFLKEPFEKSAREMEGNVVVQIRKR